MNDDRLQQYVQHNKEGDQFKEYSKERDAAKEKVSELESNKAEIEGKLRGQEFETPEGEQKYEELKGEQDANEANLYGARDDLSAKEAKLESFKEANYNKSTEPTTNNPAAPASAPDQSKGYDSTQPEMNERLKPSEDIKDWNDPAKKSNEGNDISNSNNEDKSNGSVSVDPQEQGAQEGQEQENDPRLAGLNNEAIESAKNQGQELQQQGVEQAQPDMDR